MDDEFKFFLALVFVTLVLTAGINVYGNGFGSGYRAAVSNCQSASKDPHQ